MICVVVVLLPFLVVKFLLLVCKLIPVTSCGVVSIIWLSFVFGKIDELF